MDMKCVVLKEPNLIEIETRPIPVPGPREVLLEILYGGICGSDVLAYHGKHFMKKYPLIQGHEFSAKIVQVDPDNAYGLKEGMLVTGLPYYGCGVCHSCKKGFVQCCPQNKTIGALQDGAFAQYFVLPDWRVYDCTGLTPKQAALVEPFVIGCHAAKRPEIQPGDRTLIIGAGTIGLVTAIMAKSFGADVTIADVEACKLDIAKNHFGIPHTLHNDDAATFLEKTKEATHGDGFDIVMEAVGLPQTFQNSLESVCIGGKVVVIGIGKMPFEFDFGIIEQKHLNIYGSRNGLKEDFLATIDLMRKGTLGDVQKMITAIFPYTKAASAFYEIDKLAGSVLKAMLEFVAC